MVSSRAFLPTQAFPGFSCGTLSKSHNSLEPVSWSGSQALFKRSKAVYVHACGRLQVIDKCGCNGWLRILVPSLLKLGTPSLFANVGIYLIPPILKALQDARMCVFVHMHKYIHTHNKCVYILQR